MVHNYQDFICSNLMWYESRAGNGLAGIAGLSNTNGQEQYYTVSGDDITLPLTGPNGETTVHLIAANIGGVNAARGGFGGTAFSDFLKNGTSPSLSFPGVQQSWVDYRDDPIPLTPGGVITGFQDNANNAEIAFISAIICWGGRLPPPGSKWYHDRWMGYRKRGEPFTDGILTGTQAAGVKQGGNSLFDNLDNISARIDTQREYVVGRLVPYAGLATTYSYFINARKMPLNTFNNVMFGADVEGSGKPVFNDGYLLNVIGYSGETQATLDGIAGTTTDTRVHVEQVKLP